jgi:AcrR family transcriptional regulator
MVGDPDATVRAKPTRTRTRLDPEVRREQIIDAAEGVFARRALPEVTFEELAEAAGVSRALVYNYFGDKGGLIAAVHLRACAQLDTELDRALGDRSSLGSDQIRSLARAYLRFASRHPGAWKLIGTVEAGEHPEVQEARERRCARLAATWGGAAEARLRARGIVGFLEAATLGWLDDPALDLEAAADVAHAQLWDGLAPLEARPAVSRA